MTLQPARRFWKDVSVRTSGDVFKVCLDGRTLTTPAKTDLCLPNEALANAVAAEWRAQHDNIDPATMPMTRRANAAVDKVTPQQSEVTDMLAEYGASDLLCYRAAYPRKLADRQEAAWGPLLAWARQEFGADLVVTTGVVHVAQRPDDIARLASAVRAFSPFPLTGFHDLVTMTGSLVIGLAAARKAFPDQDLWDRAQVDESWQVEEWGNDAEAAERAAHRKQDFADALKFFRLTPDKVNDRA